MIYIVSVLFELCLNIIVWFCYGFFYMVYFSVFEGELFEVIFVVYCSLVGCRIIGCMCVGKYFNWDCVECKISIILRLV